METAKIILNCISLALSKHLFDFINCISPTIIVVNLAIAFIPPQQIYFLGKREKIASISKLTQWGHKEHTSGSSASKAKCVRYGFFQIHFWK